MGPRLPLSQHNYSDKKSDSVRKMTLPTKSVRWVQFFVSDKKSDPVYGNSPTKSDIHSDFFSELYSRKIRPCALAMKQMGMYYADDVRLTKVRVMYL